MVSFLRTTLMDANQPTFDVVVEVSAFQKFRPNRKGESGAVKARVAPLVETTWPI